MATLASWARRSRVPSSRAARKQGSLDPMLSHTLTLGIAAVVNAPNPCLQIIASTRL